MKALKIIFISFLAVIVLLAGILQYRKCEASKTLIPPNVDLMLKLNTDELLKSVLLNVPLNLGYYSKSSKKRKGTKKKSLSDVIEIPASVFAYTLKSHQKTTFFTRFAIDDYQNFKRYVSQSKGLKSAQKLSEGLILVTSSDKKLSFCYDQKSVVICYSQDAENVTQLLADLIAQKDFVAAAGTDFAEVLEGKHHLVFGNQQSFGFLDFEVGEIHSEFRFITDKLLLSQNPKHQIFKQNQIASFWMDADFKNIPNRVFNFKNFKLESDSLLRYYKGYLDFEWAGVTTQKDSVITYEYNDDFEKEEKVSVKERKIPAFTLKVSADAQAMKNYLVQQNLLDPLSGNVSSKAFPLYQLQTFARNHQFLIGTKSTAKADSASRSSDFMQLRLNFKRMKMEYPIPFLTSYFNEIDQLYVSGKAEAKNGILLTGKANLANREINAFSQLFGGF